MKKNKDLEKLNRRLRDEERERQDRKMHSRAYHTFFEGYSEYYETDASGKQHLRRVYTGEYYTLDGTKKQRVLYKIALGLIWLLAAVIFVFCSTRKGLANNVWYGAAAVVGGVIGYAWMAIGLFNYYAAPRKMTIGDWKSGSVRLKKGSVFAAVFSALAALMTLLHLCLCGGDWMHAVCAVGFVLCGALAVLENRLESRAHYTRIESTAVVPKESAHIR